MEKEKSMLAKIGEALGIFFIDEEEEKELEQLEEQVQELQGYETPGNIEKLEKLVDSKKDTKGGKSKSSFADGLKVKTSSKGNSNLTKVHDSEGKTREDE